LGIRSSPVKSIGGDGDGVALAVIVANEHHAGFAAGVTDLMKAGLSKDQITTMGREVTGKLLMG
jgi:hypothetical protein